MKSLKGIASFVAVASTGSFAAAAKLQGVSAVAVRKNVSTLERQMAVRLFQRTTRKLHLTAEGAAYFKRCQGPLRELELAQAAVQNSSHEITGLVRVTSVSPIGMVYLVPMVADFQVLYPKVQVELHLDDTAQDMVDKAYDVGIRVGPLQNSSHVARSIAKLPFVLCASPDYLRRKGAPKDLADLLNHNCLHLRRAGNNDAMPWFLAGMSHEASKKLPGNFLANDFFALMSACAQGMGVACMPLPLAMAWFRSGQLKPVLTEHIQSKFEVYLHYPSRKNLPERTRCFVDFVLERLRQEDDLQKPHRQLVAPFVS
jgi:DNA-binding transcriptional LysR family regulator